MMRIAGTISFLCLLDFGERLKYFCIDRSAVYSYNLAMKSSDAFVSRLSRLKADLPCSLELLYVGHIFNSYSGVENHGLSSFYLVQ